MSIDYKYISDKCTLNMQIVIIILQNRACLSIILQTALGIVKLIISLLYISDYAVLVQFITTYSKCEVYGLRQAV